MTDYFGPQLPKTAANMALLVRALRRVARAAQVAPSYISSEES